MWCVIEETGIPLTDSISDVAFVAWKLACTNGIKSAENVGELKERNAVRQMEEGLSEGFTAGSTLKRRDIKKHKIPGSRIINQLLHRKKFSKLPIQPFRPIPIMQQIINPNPCNYF